LTKIVTFYISNLHSVNTLHTTLLYSFSARLDVENRRDTRQAYGFVGQYNKLLTACSTKWCLLNGTYGGSYTWCIFWEIL